MPNDTDPHQPQPHSQLFTVRLWHDPEQPNEPVPTMQVRHLLSGETRSFSTWLSLIDYMRNTLDSVYGLKGTRQR